MGIDRQLSFVLVFVLFAPPREPSRVSCFLEPRGSEISPAARSSPLPRFVRVLFVFFGWFSFLFNFSFCEPKLSGMSKTASRALRRTAGFGWHQSGKLRACGAFDTDNREDHSDLFSLFRVYMYTTENVCSIRLSAVSILSTLRCYFFIFMAWVV